MKNQIEQFVSFMSEVQSSAAMSESKALAPEEIYQAAKQLVSISHDLRKLSMNFAAGDEKISPQMQAKIEMGFQELEKLAQNQAIV